jgi:hypothetical protein
VPRAGQKRASLWHELVDVDGRFLGWRRDPQVNTNVAAMTDAELADYRQLLRELKALLPEEVPKVIEGIVAR